MGEGFRFLQRPVSKPIRRGPLRAVLKESRDNAGVNCTFHRCNLVRGASPRCWLFYAHSLGGKSGRQTSHTVFN